MELHSLSLKNFKGIKNFTLETNGKNVNVFGDNATGKTTIFDALNWLLFGKDSANRADFEIKTLDSSGVAIPNIDHEVEGIFLVDGKNIALCRTYKEVYKGIRGSTQKELTGHTTDYKINGVPVKEKDYNTKIELLVPVSIFKLITNPLFFNEQLKPMERRQKLLELCGGLTEADVINSNPSLTQLATILSGRSVEDHKKVVAARKAAINKELQLIPARIDELNNTLPDVMNSLEVLQLQKSQIEAELDGLRSKKLMVENGQAVIDEKAELGEINRKISDLYLSLTESSRRSKKLLEQNREELTRKKAMCESERQHLSERITSAERNITMYKSKAEQLSQKFTKENAKVFIPNVIDACPTCGQSLPEGQVAEAISKANEEFNVKKVATLTAIREEKKSIESSVVHLEKEKSENFSFMAKTNIMISDADCEIGIIDMDLDLMVDVDPSKNTEYKALLDKKSDIEKTLYDTQSLAIDRGNEIREDINSVSDKLQQVMTELSQEQSRKSIIKRIEELTNQERALSEEFETLERDTYLMEEFIKSKVSMLEDSINHHFKVARFKMFDTLVNGSVEECCETLYNNVPFKSMNNAARINVGLDIINALTAHYKVSAPVFIDNAEAVTEFIPCNSQIIKLIVSEQDKNLRVEEV